MLDNETKSIINILERLQTTKGAYQANLKNMFVCRPKHFRLGWAVGIYIFLLTVPEKHTVVKKFIMQSHKISAH